MQVERLADALEELEATDPRLARVPMTAVIAAGMMTLSNIRMCLPSVQPPIADRGSALCISKNAEAKATRGGRSCSPASARLEVYARRSATHGSMSIRRSRRSPVFRRSSPRPGPDRTSMRLSPQFGVLQNDEAPGPTDDRPLLDLVQGSEAPEADQAVIQAAVAYARRSIGAVDVSH